MSRSPRDAALMYAGNGYYVVPVSPDGRTLGAASKNLSRVGDWWLRWPDAQIGLDLGRSKMMVIEINAANAEHLAAAQSLLPVTITAGAGNMRRYFYRYSGKGSLNVSRSIAGTEFKIYSGNSVVVVPS